MYNIYVYTYISKNNNYASYVIVMKIYKNRIIIRIEKLVCNKRLAY